MKLTGTRLTFRLLTLVVAAVLAIGAVACGGSDDDGDDQGSATAAGDKDPGGSSSGTTDAAQGGTPEEQIRAAYATFVDGFYKQDPAAICDGMTKSAQKRFGAQMAGRQGAKGTASCESQMKLLIESADEFSKNKPSIVKLKVTGNKAKIGAKTRNSDTYIVPYAKEGGVWKVSGGFGQQ